MKLIGTTLVDTNGIPEVVYAWKAGGSFFVETPFDGAVMNRDQMEQLVAELESLLRED